MKKMSKEMSNEFFLLIDSSRESDEAIKILKKNHISFKPILVEPGGHLPSLLTPGNVYEKLNGIKYFVESRKKKGVKR